MSTNYPTPPVIGTRVLVMPFGQPPYKSVVTGFDPYDGAVFVAGGEIVANHLPDCSNFEVIR